MTKKLLALGLLLASLAPTLYAAGAHKTFQENDFSKGLDSYHNATTLPPGFVQESLNVLFDDRAPVQKRSGYTVAWSTSSARSFTGLWTYTDQTNTTWQIARSSTNITASNLSGSVVAVATVSASNLVGETNAFGRAYFVDQTQGLYYWNGTSTTYVTSAPKGSIIAQFHNRLWITGAAVPNGNQLYGSAYYDGNTWTTGLNDNDPVQYSIGLQDNFDNITAEYVYLDTLYLFKHYSIFALYGFGQSTFQISQLTQECGCIDGGTIQTYNGGLKFVSLRGLEDFNGYSCKRISDPVKNLIDPAIQIGGFSSQSWVQQNATDWNAGTFNTSTSLSSSIAPPSLVLSTGILTDISASDFNGGTFNNTRVSSIGVILSTNNTNVANSTFESCSGSPANWTGGWGCNGSLVNDNCTINPFGGSFQIAADAHGSVPTLTANLKDCNTSSILQTTNVSWASNSCTYANQVLSQSGDAGRLVKIFFTNGSVTEVSDCFLSNGSNITFHTASDSASTAYRFTIDNINNGKSSLTSGNFTSRVFDTGFSSSAVSVSISSTSNTEPITFVLRHSTASDGQFVDLTSTQSVGILSNRYLQYRTTFTAADTDSGLSALVSSTITFTASSGTFKSQIKNVGSITAWGNFSVQEVLNDGAIAFSICSSTNSDMSIPLSCASQAINSQITVSTGVTGTGIYTQWFATFTVTAATQTPQLQSGTVQWFTGSAQVPMASTVWDNRYWLSLTTTTSDTANDAVIVLSSRGAFSLFDIHAGAFTQYKNSLYHADSRASGNIYLDNQGFGDNGNPINAFIKTRELSMGDLASDDYLYAVYPEAFNTGNCSMSVQYEADRSSSYALGSPLLSEYSSMSSVRLPMPVDDSHQDFAQAFNFMIGTDDASCDWQFYGLQGLYRSRPVQ